MTLRRTPLYDQHKKLGAKLVPFAGWEMPIQYSGVINEHNAVRSAAGLFDVSHMGEIFVEGEEAELSLEELTCNKVSNLYDGKAQYSAITNDEGGVIDDVIIYRFSKQRFLICVNASNAETDFQWFLRRNQRKAAFKDRSSDFSLLALQGPMAAEILGKFEECKAALDLQPFHFTDIKIAGIELMAARTGYTGEDGFELFTPWFEAQDVWSALLESGRDKGLLPCGLGARDTLRLEACYPLHGHELSPAYSAIESGLGWIVKFDKPDYPGKNILEQQKQNGAKKGIAGFIVEDSGIAREGSKVFDQSDNEIGHVTSGTKTPTLNRALGLALIDSSQKEPGTKIKIQVRDKFLNATVTQTPFYKKGKP